MCIHVYIGSNRPLPTLAWDEAAPAFHARPVTDPAVLETLGHYGFRFPYVHEACSFMNCGCGLTYGAWSRDDPREEHEKRVRDVHALFAWLAANRAGRELVLFSTDYEGELSPAPRGVLDPGILPAVDTEFEFPEKVLLDVVAGE